jgi:hypothetical protein
MNVMTIFPPKDIFNFLEAKKNKVVGCFCQRLRSTLQRQATLLLLNWKLITNDYAVALEGFHKTNIFSK